MDEVELPKHTRDSRTGLRRLAPEIEAARDKIIDHFEDKPFAELKEFVQQLLENEGINIENDKVINFEKVFWDPKDMDDNNKSNLILIDG